MFDTDEANLTAWQEAWGQHHHWVHDAGPAVLIGISTTRYRSNEMSHHEVHVDAEQRAWLRRVLRDVAPEKPAVLFSHAPPMGCGLKVIHNLHVKNRCAHRCMHAAIPPGLQLHTPARSRGHRLDLDLIGSLGICF